MVQGEGGRRMASREESHLGWPEAIFETGETVNHANRRERLVEKYLEMKNRVSVPFRAPDIKHKTFSKVKTLCRDNCPECW